MKNLKYALFCIFVFLACRKDVQTKPDPVPAPKPVVIAPVQEINSLLLDSAYFKPSVRRISFKSTAIGRTLASGSPISIQLADYGWTHPSVLYFEHGWQGYHYWAALTPYLNADSQWENPHVFCSQNGLDWAEPVGVANPIAFPTISTSNNSDVNLMYNEKDGYLYCYWRESGIQGGRGLMYRKTHDGLTWSPSALVCLWPGLGMDVTSPAIIDDGKKFMCYAINTGEKVRGSYYTNYSVRKMQSSQAGAGFIPVPDSSYKLVDIMSRPWGIEQDPWHLEVKKYKNLYLMLVSTTNHKVFGGGGKLFLGYSLDGTHFVFGAHSLSNTSGSTYKSSFIPEYNEKTHKLDIKLWRAMINDNWTIYYDTFSIPLTFKSTGPLA